MSLVRWVSLMAVETSSARVLGEGEQRIAGWTLLSPEDRNVKISPKLEEKVLLLVSPVRLSEEMVSDVSEQSRNVCCIIQLLARKGHWLHPNPPSIRHIHTTGCIHLVSTAGSWP